MTNERVFLSNLKTFDGVTYKHSVNVAQISALIAKELPKVPGYKISAEEAFQAGLFHDAGKLFVDPAIINKPDKLTDVEFNKIKSHTVKAELALKDTNKTVKEAAKFHHEKWNGKGYPCNLKGIEIPMVARLVAVADVYEALTAKRQYKEPMKPKVVRGIINEEKGESFDPVVVNAFNKAFDTIVSLNDSVSA